MRSLCQVEYDERNALLRFRQAESKNIESHFNMHNWVSQRKIKKMKKREEESINFLSIATLTNIFNLNPFLDIAYMHWIFIKSKTKVFNYVTQRLWVVIKFNSHSKLFFWYFCGLCEIELIFNGWDGLDTHWHLDCHHFATHFSFIVIW